KMEEAVVKQGVLYLQLQQTFGKKWKRFWAVLSRESSCCSSRLEFFEGSCPPPPEKLRRGEGSKKMLKLSDCVLVAEATGEPGCPKDTSPFLLETTEKRYLLAAEGSEVSSWIQKLCELAFPRNREEQAAGKDGQQQISLNINGEFSMEENSLYSCRAKGSLEQAFEVTVRGTESSERCQLWGRCILRAGQDALELLHCQSLELLYSWPYRFLRRFGRDKVTFSFEAGRRCTSGEGNFEFETQQGNEIFQAIEAAINLQRGRGLEEQWKDDASRPLSHAKKPSWAQGQEEPAGTKYALLEPTWEGKMSKGKVVIPVVPEKSWRQDAPAKTAIESEYATPFDTITKTLVACQLSSLGQHPKKVLDPLYASIGEAGGQAGKQQQPPARPEHIYDEPEGFCSHIVYDEPEEVKGEAWRLQAAPEEPLGHEYPYNPQRDDYAVPKRAVPARQPFLLQGKEWLRDTDYDNVALRFATK
ncbi:DOK2 protein, partial [Bucco capensis]|nr:DOK2 protein [Bucco capensis]